MKIELEKLTIRKAHEHMKRGDFSAVELVEAYLNEIKNKNPEINAYLEIYDDVLEQAKAADKKFKDKTASFLTGIPLAVKDNILINGKKVSCASKILEGYKATYDATVIAKLKNEGAVFLGRTNLDEFAMGGSTENSAFGVTKNPHDVSRVAGGSSGGSAAAVAMGGALAAIGSDTGGSVRQPASFCGVVGLKPTYGAVSRHGLIAMGSSLDQIGPITNSVEDAEIIFDAINGRDSLDSTSIDISKKESNKKLVIGVPAMMKLNSSLDGCVLKDFEASTNKLIELGYDLKSVNLPNLEYSLPVYYILMPAEASTNLARFDGVKYGLHKEGKNLLGDYLETRGSGFGKEVRRRIILGAYVLSSGYYDAYYNRAQQVRELIRADFEKVFKEVDIIITPTAPSPAFKIGEKANDPLQMYLADIFTVTANIVGIPALSIPSGRVEVSGKKLPLGLQMMADFGREDLLFEVGKKFAVMQGTK